MTIHDDSLDELASAYLDNEVSTDERATVEGDPEILGRVEAFGELRDTLGASIGGVDEDLIALALGSFEAVDAEPEHATTAVGAGATTPVSAPVVRSLDEARRRRARTMYTWLGAAAAVGLAVVGFISLAPGGDDEDSAASSEREVSVPEAAFDAAEAPAATESPAASEAPAAESQVTAIFGPGEMATQSDTAAAAAETVAPVATEAPADGGAAGSSAGPPVISTQDELALQGRLYASTDGTDGDNLPKIAAIVCPDLGAETVAAIIWQGQPAYLMLRPSIVDAREALAVDDECGLLATAPLISTP